MYKRTSLEAPPSAAVRLLAAAAAAKACPRPQAIEPWPSSLMVARIQRPVRVEEGTLQHMVVGRLGRRVAEFKPRRLLRTFRRRELLALLDEVGRGARDGTCPGKSRTSAPSAASTAIE
jgi:hypothetical protein